MKKQGHDGKLPCSSLLKKRVRIQGLGVARAWQVLVPFFFFGGGGGVDERATCGKLKGPTVLGSCPTRIPEEASYALRPEFR